MRTDAGLAEDGAHESHRAFTAGPAQALLRSRIRRDRRSLPPILQRCLWWTGATLALSAMVAVYLALTEPRTLSILGQILGLSFAVGREAAMLHAYSQDPAGGPLWVLVTIVLDDLVTLGVTLPLMWIGIERLRGVPVLGGIVLSVEKTAVEKRAFLLRWGLWGLVAFVWLPGVGAGVFLAAAIGVIAKIVLRRLLVVLALAAVAVDAFWAIGLHYTAALIPQEGIWSYIPLALAAGLALLALVFGVRQHRKRHLFPIVKVQILGDQHVARLLDVGITDGIDLLYANRHVLAKKLGVDPALLGRLRSVAELCMLRTVSPRHAEMLTEVGINSIRELSVAPAHLVAAALKELERQHRIQPAAGKEERFPQQCARWTKDAKEFLAEAEPHGLHAPAVPPRSTVPTPTPERAQ